MFARQQNARPFSRPSGNLNLKVRLVAVSAAFAGGAINFCCAAVMCAATPGKIDKQLAA